MPSKKITTSINPATGEIIGKTPENTVEELEKAVALAKIAQSEWAKFSFQERAQYLLAIRDYIVENVDRISDVISGIMFKMCCYFYLGTR
jgi:acyl-CoA reductase-like NAD-dependent aldehyde dehydrogenase